eukprot:TRINITY_DN16173_c0_g1_i1.p1 TRINITY_DN16173_c0_g1~~TRINITY_DN16173_c0_g1_i1.p1  ORF type:complete len:732 (-),score=-9.15 TRINITY_DN16173_c0_g1_i1:299-2494(-)
MAGTRIPLALSVLFALYAIGVAACPEQTAEFCAVAENPSLCREVICSRADQAAALVRRGRSLASTGGSSRTNDLLTSLAVEAAEAEVRGLRGQAVLLQSDPSSGKREKDVARDCIDQLDLASSYLVKAYESLRSNDEPEGQAHWLSAALSLTSRCTDAVQTLAPAAASPKGFATAASVSTGPAADVVQSVQSGLGKACREYIGNAMSIVAKLRGINDDDDDSDSGVAGRQTLETAVSYERDAAMEAISGELQEVLDRDYGNGGAADAARVTRGGHAARSASHRRGLRALRQMGVSSAHDGADPDHVSGRPDWVDAHEERSLRELQRFMRVHYRALREAFPSNYSEHWAAHRGKRILLATTSKSKAAAPARRAPVKTPTKAASPVRRAPAKPSPKPAAPARSAPVRWVVPKAETTGVKLPSLQPDYIINKDGRDGHYKTISEVAEKLSMDEMLDRRRIVFISAGFYREKVVVRKDRVVFLGEGSAKTSIAFWGAQPKYTVFDSATVGINAHEFTAMGVTIANVAGHKAGPAIAFRCEGDKSAFYDVVFLGHQDTLAADAGRQYYTNCVMRGTVDFVFGVASAVFENNTYIIRKPPLPWYQGCISAQGRTAKTDPSAFVFLRGRVIGESPGNYGYLGRPWWAYSRSIYVNTYLSAVVNPAGWLEWDYGGGKKTVWGGNPYFAESGTFGPGARGPRAKWSNPTYLNSRQSWRYYPNKFLALRSWVKETMIPYGG